MNHILEWQDTVSNLQIDMTSHCNARCAGCVRQVNGTTTVKPELPLTNFSLDVWKRLATQDTRGWFIKELVLNGNWGDPMMHPNLVEMLDTWVEHHPETFLIIHTNGSMRSLDFWHKLGKTCRKFPNHMIMFAIDGLEDTHSIYRVRTKYNKILENIKSFTNAKGRAKVIMTAFEHNKHQIKQVEEVAKSLGCIEFEVRESHLPHTVQDGVTIEETDIETYQVQFAEHNWPMSDARDAEIYNEIQLPRFDTKCPWYNDRQVQIDPWMQVWPCCHVSHFGLDHTKANLAEVDNSFLDARKTNGLINYTLSEILSNDWFSEVLPDAISDASWQTCRETCGVCKDG